MKFTCALFFRRIFLTALLGLALAPLSCGENNQQGAQIAADSSSLKNKLLLPNDNNQLVGQDFKTKSSIYSVHGVVANTNEVKIYHFGVALSSQEKIDQRIFLTDFRNSRTVIFDLFVGDEADIAAAIYEPSFAGNYNLSPGAAQTRRSRWGSGTVKSFDQACQSTNSGMNSDGIQVVSGIVSVEHSFKNLLLQYDLQYHIVLENGEIVHGHTTLSKIHWPSHLNYFSELKCAIPTSIGNR